MTKEEIFVAIVGMKQLCEVNRERDGDKNNDFYRGYTVAIDQILMRLGWSPQDLLEAYLNSPLIQERPL